MSNKTQLQANNTQLAALIETLQGKAAGGGGSSANSVSGAVTYYLEETNYAPGANLYDIELGGTQLSDIIVLKLMVAIERKYKSSNIPTTTNTYETWLVKSQLTYGLTQVIDNLSNKTDCFTGHFVYMGADNLKYLGTIRDTYTHSTGSSSTSYTDTLTSFTFEAITQ